MRRVSVPKRPMSVPSTAVVGIAVALLVGACTSDGDDAPSGATTGTEETEQRFPDVVSVDVETTANGYDFVVTISSPYDTPQRYADGWRVIDRDGTVYGEHTLAHDHANEQPFTRRQIGVEIPPDVDEVVVEARDQEYGYGGATVSVTLP